jgi:hypothetical protein
MHDQQVLFRVHLALKSGATEFNTLYNMSLITIAKPKHQAASSFNSFNLKAATVKYAKCMKKLKQMMWPNPHR